MSNPYRVSDTTIAEVKAHEDQKREEDRRSRAIATLVAWIPLDIVGAAEEIYGLRKERDELVDELNQLYEERENV